MRRVPVFMRRKNGDIVQIPQIAIVDEEQVDPNKPFKVKLRGDLRPEEVNTAYTREAKNKTVPNVPYLLLDGDIATIDMGPKYRFVQPLNTLQN